MMPDELAKVRARAKSGARSATRSVSAWREDVEQELVLMALEMGAQAFLVKSARIMGLEIVERWFGQKSSKRRAMESHDEFDAEAAIGMTVAAARHEGFLAWHRLREAWGTMTPNMRAGIYCVITGATPTEAAKETGAKSMQCVDYGRRAALARVDMPPSWYARKARDYRDEQTKRNERRLRSQLAAAE